MPLKLRLKPGEKIVVNGCVIQNDNRRNTLTISNTAQIMRGRDVLQPEDANTPVRRAYFSIQAALLDAATAAELRAGIIDQLAQLHDAFLNPEMRGNIAVATAHVEAGDHYKALAALRPVMAYEEQVLPGAPPLQRGGTPATLDPS